MPNVRTNTGEAILGLCHLMRDLEILASELFVAEEAERLPIGTHQAPLSDRLSRIGVDDQKIENFNAWRQTLSDLTDSDSRDDNRLAKIAAAEKSGLIVLAKLIDALRTRDRQTKASNVRVTALAA